MDNVWEIKTLQNKNKELQLKLSIANARIDKLESCMKNTARAITQAVIGTPESRAFACRIAAEIERHYLK
jgi:hypothetical protein